MLEKGLLGLGALIGYFVAVILCLFLLKKICVMPREVFRKTLHIFAVMSILVVLAACDAWQAALFTVLAFAVIVFPVLLLLERLPIYGRILPERKPGEIKKSLVLYFIMMGILIAIFWGWLGAQWKFIILITMMAWGFGDAAAALIGKAFGRHPVKHRWADGKKTAEGTISMWVVSGAVIFIVSALCSIAPWYICLLISALVAPVCALVELFSKGGMDTLTVPVTTGFFLFFAFRAFALLGA